MAVKKILSYTLIVIAVLLIILPIIINKDNEKKKIKVKRDMENKMTEFCNYAFIDLDKDTGEVWVTIAEMKKLFDYDISLFENKKYACDLSKSHIEATIEDDKLICKPVLSCKYLSK